MNSKQNFFGQSEINQFQRKNDWLCNFVLNNISSYDEAVSKNIMDMALTYKCSAIFATLKIIDLTNYLILKKEDVENQQDTIDLLNSLKEYIDMSVGLDNFDNNTILANIKDLITNVVIPINKNIQVVEDASVMRWGKDMNFSKKAKGEKQNSAQTTVQQNPLPTQPTINQQTVQNQMPQNYQLNDSVANELTKKAHINGNDIPLQRPGNQNTFLNNKFKMLEQQETNMQNLSNISTPQN